MTYAYSLDGGETYRGSEPTPEALRLAAQIKDRFGATVSTSQAAAELRRQHEEIERLQAQVAELTAEVEIARKDALRYRWLRNESWAGYNQRGGLPQVWTTDGAGNRKTMLAEDAMDEAIDRARGC